MTRPSLRFRLAVLMVAVILAAPWPATAAPRPDRSGSSAPGGFFSILWNRLTVGWEAIGCFIDPSGGCAADQSDAGCGIDPSGLCAASGPDEGCGIDPSGRCTASYSDEGCGLDPSGRCLPGS